MKTTSLFRLAFLLIFGVLTLVGCREDSEDPGIYRETGFIIAGETSTGLRMIDYAGYPLRLSSGGMNGNSHDFALNTAGDLHLVLGASSYSGTGYSGSSATAAGSVEFAAHHFQDSILVCYDFSPDSTQTIIYHYSASLGSNCQNIPTLEEVRTLTFGDVLSENTRIDESLSWLNAPVYLDFVGERFTVGGPTGNQIDQYYTGHQAWAQRGVKYLGFRVWDSGVWHYGYVKLETVAGELRVHRIVYEVI